jgi:hypothetical protein
MVYQCDFWGEHNWIMIRLPICILGFDSPSLHRKYKVINCNMMIN